MYAIWVWTFVLIIILLTGLSLKSINKKYEFFKSRTTPYVRQRDRELIGSYFDLSNISEPRTYEKEINYIRKQLKKQDESVFKEDIGAIGIGYKPLPSTYLRPVPLCKRDYTRTPDDFRKFFIPSDCIKAKYI